MLKKILSVFMVCIMVFTLTGCDDKSDEKNKPDTTNGDSDTGKKPVERPFTDSTGFIRSLIIEDIPVTIPETVGEYAKYLEQVGTKLELIANPTKPDTVTDLGETLKANDQSSLNAYFKVYVSDGKYHKFGLHYKNDTDKDIDISEAKIDRLNLYYDLRSSDGVPDPEQPELYVIDSITCVTDSGNIVIDNDTKSKYIRSILGNPVQDTDGYLTYNDESGFVYKFATANKPGILTQVDIKYPK